GGNSNRARRVSLPWASPDLRKPVALSVPEYGTLKFHFLELFRIISVCDPHRNRHRRALLRSTSRSPGNQGGPRSVRRLESHCRKGAVEDPRRCEECTPKGEHSQERPSGV